jgi:RNA polymerase sigma factor (sigma-70 family)
MRMPVLRGKSHARTNAKAGFRGSLIPNKKQVVVTGILSMSQIKPHDEDDRKRRRQAFERYCTYVIAVRRRGLRASPRLDKALTAINATLLALAHFFFRDERNLSRRHELASDAVAEWHAKMLATGFDSYLVRQTGQPFTPYAIRSLHNICVDFRRRLGRERAIASSAEERCDGREDSRCAAELRELERDCSEAMKSLAPEVQECLRLIYWEGVSCGEVAERTGRNPRTIATWHSRARRRLAVEFRKRGYWPV